MSVLELVDLSRQTAVVTGAVVVLAAFLTGQVLVVDGGWTAC